MTAKTNKDYSWDDVIFEFRNKEYGAYDLRKQYPARMLKSLIFTLAVIAGLVSLLELLHKPVVMIKDPTVISQVVDLSKKPVFILPTPPAPMHHASHSVPYTEAPPVVVRQTETIRPKLQTVDHTPAISSPTGEISGPGAIDVPAGSGTSTTASTGNTSADNAGAARTPEITAEYPGGYAALSAFVARHLRYPAAAVEKGAQGRVVVSFTLDETGSVQEATVLNSVGDGCDEEAVRVIKLLKFRPASQNGNNVKFRFILPISFHLQGQD